jgi:hypothetical protein
MGPAATPSQVDLSAVMAIAHSSNQATMRRAAGASRREPGECNMNATATIAHARPQYMRALERANEVRLARAELKRRVAFGEINVAEVILHCPCEAHSMAVAELLMSQRRWGQTRCRNTLAQLLMSDKKTVGSLTDRQRRALAAMLTSAERGRAWSATP